MNQITNNMTITATFYNQNLEILCKDSFEYFFDFIFWKYRKKEKFQRKMMSQSADFRNVVGIL